MSTEPAPSSAAVRVAATPSLARSAGMLALGSIASRGFGLLREIVIARYFGASGAVSAFRIAAQIPTLLYDFLVGGLLSAALVPIFSEYALRDRRAFVYLVRVLLTLFVSGLTLVVLLLEAAAPTLTWLLAAGFRTAHPELLFLTTQLIRLVAPVVWLMGVAGVLTAVLYAVQRFTFPALATAIFNLGILVVTPFLAPRLGILCLAVGLVLGGVAQVALMAWDLRRAGVSLRWRVDLRHPALRRILRLYLPIAGGMLVAMFQVGLDRRLASTTGEQSIAWMANATTLQQLPLGLISVAISLASLPRLSQYFVDRDEERYRTTLARGLRSVLLLIAPAAVGLWLLGLPVTQVLFERGEFTHADTIAVVRALDIYIVGMLFAAIDFPLNYAFYARNNTLLPALVGVLSVGVYVAVAFALVGRMGYLGLVWADTAKQASHALVMLGLIYWQVGPLSIGRDIVRIVLAMGIMAGAMWVAAHFVPFPFAGLAASLLTITLVGGVGVGAYLATLQTLGVAELQSIWRLLRG